ncbi:hypothetical protein ANCDUO_03789 [Ancylostoma duodenale]|uniref:Uncharacterized protein n=1 Tax=Ancylostoma duodenale TaxID=51022 RepID=A0A0C2H8P1_9BILA|nr:hypothetical protein ANCDUO_03789 [Ancylostoma duodenale]
MTEQLAVPANKSSRSRTRRKIVLVSSTVVMSRCQVGKWLFLSVYFLVAGVCNWAVIAYTHDFATRTDHYLLVATDPNVKNLENIASDREGLRPNSIVSDDSGLVCCGTTTTSGTSCVLVG